MVTWVPAAPVVGETPVTIGGAGARGILTVTAVLPVMLPKAAVIVVLPAEADTTTAGFPGMSNTVATELLEEDQVTSEVRFMMLPSE